MAQKVLSRFGICSKYMHLPITLYCDNSGVVANSKESRSHKRDKHIKRKYYLIREIVQRGDIIIKQIVSEHNIVDPFTKALTAKVFGGDLVSLGLRVVQTRTNGRKNYEVSDTLVYCIYMLFLYKLNIMYIYSLKFQSK